MTTRQPFGIRAPPIEESAQFLRNYISGQANSFSHPDPPTFDIIQQGHQIYNPFDDDFYLDREVEKILENAEDNTINNCAPSPVLKIAHLLITIRSPKTKDTSKLHQESTVIFNESSLEFEKYSEFFTLFSEIESKEPQGPYVRPATCKIIDLQDSSTQTEPNIVSKP
ncbi:hypothetical protein ACOME3_008826 [Neoechinorhynchus agilis]